MKLDEKTHLTVEELAMWLNVKPQMIRKLVFHKKIPMYRVGSKLLRFNIDEIKTWLESQRVETINYKKERLK